MSVENMIESVLTGTKTKRVGGMTKLRKCIDHRILPYLESKLSNYILQQGSLCNQNFNLIAINPNNRKCALIKIQYSQTYKSQDKLTKKQFPYCLWLYNPKEQIETGIFRFGNPNSKDYTLIKKNTPLNHMADFYMVVSNPFGLDNGLCLLFDKQTYANLLPKPINEKTTLWTVGIRFNFTRKTQTIDKIIGGKGLNNNESIEQYMFDKQAGNLIKFLN